MFNTVGYWVIYQDEDSVVTYDCHDTATTGLDYCIHIMSATRQMDAAKLAYLKSFAENRGLNLKSLPL